MDGLFLPSHIGLCFCPSIPQDSRLHHSRVPRTSFQFNRPHSAFRLLLSDDCSNQDLDRIVGRSPGRTHPVWLEHAIHHVGHWDLHSALHRCRRAFSRRVHRRVPNHHFCSRLGPFDFVGIEQGRRLV